MRKPKSSQKIAPSKRTGARLFAEVSSIPNRLHARILTPIRRSTGRGVDAMRRTQATTVGSIATFMAAVLDLDSAHSSPSS